MGSGPLFRMISLCNVLFISYLSNFTTSLYCAKPHRSRFRLLDHANEDNNGLIPITPKRFWRRRALTKNVAHKERLIESVSPLKL